MDENESKLVPAKSMTVEEFSDHVRNLLDMMLEDHHDLTGTETQEWPDWIEDLTNAYLNS